MGCVEGDVTEEWALFVLLDEFDRVLGEVINDESFALNEFAVVFERRVEVAAPVAGGESVVLVEAARVGMVRPLAAVVPFAECAGGIMSGFEGVADGGFVEVKAFAAGGDAVNAAARMVAASEKLGAGGGTDGADVKMFEHCAGAGEGIYVGGGK